MYHGIIQEAAWSGPGTYLRARIEQYGLDKVVHKGRIWRVRHTSMARDPERPRIGDAEIQIGQAGGTSPRRRDQRWRQVHTRDR